MNDPSIPGPRPADPLIALRPWEAPEVTSWGRLPMNAVGPGRPAPRPAGAGGRAVGGARGAPRGGARGTGGGRGARER
ncbi:hypothetical protein ACFV23_56820, partial [Streptomyces sp. NPDC059627]